MEVKALQVLQENRNITFTTVTNKNCPRSCIVTLLKLETLDTLYFSIRADSNKAKNIENNPQVCICQFVEKDGDMVSLSGIATILDNQELKDELWYDGLLRNFSSKEDPLYKVVKFNTKKADLIIGFRPTTISFE